MSAICGDMVTKTELFFFLREGKPVTTEDHAAIQKDIGMLEKWTDRNLIKFNKENYKVLHNPWH